MTQTSRSHPQSEHILRRDVSTLCPQVLLRDGPAVHLAPPGLEPLQNPAASLAVPRRRRSAVPAAWDVVSNRRVAAGFGSAHRSLRSVALPSASFCFSACLRSSLINATRRRWRRWCRSVGERSSSCFCKHMLHSCHDNSSWGGSQRGVRFFSSTRWRWTSYIYSWKNYFDLRKSPPPVN